MSPTERLARMKSPARVLIVEDEDSARSRLAALLGDRGHRVTAVATGPEALDAAAKTDFDIVFCGLLLAGMSGFAVLSALVKKRRGLAVVVMSSYPTDEVRSGATLLGAFGFLPKPVDIAAAESFIARALARTPPPRAPAGEAGPRG